MGQRARIKKNGKSRGIKRKRQEINDVHQSIFGRSCLHCYCRDTNNYSNSALPVF